MGTLSDLLVRSHRSGLTLTVEGEALRFTARQGSPDPQLLADLRAHRSELIAFLRDVGEEDHRPAVERTEHLPLSFAQERLWFIDRLGLAGAAYNSQMAIELAGALDIGALQVALDALVRRHEILRTRYGLRNAEPVQVIDPPYPVVLRRNDISAPAGVVDDTRLEALIVEERLARFDLEAGPLLRALLVRRAPELHVLVLTLHHICTDGWSMDLIARDIGRAYGSALEGRGDEAAQPAPQYADFALRQRHSGHQDRVDRGAAFWRSHLAGVPPLLDLAYDRPRPARASFGGGFVRRRLAPMIAKRIRDWAHGENATLFMALLAIWAAVLARRSGQGRVVIGAPVAGRPEPRLEEVVGLFVNMLPLCVAADADMSFARLLQHTRRVVLDGLAHQDTPFERIVADAGVAGDLSHHPIFQAGFALQNIKPPRFDMPGVTARLVAPGHHTALFDLGLFAEEDDGTIILGLEYATDLFDEASAVAILEAFAHACDLASADPTRALRSLAPCAPASGSAIAAASPVRRPPGDIASAFDTRAEASSGATALICGDRRVTYRDLRLMADGLAARLADAGVAPESIVGLALPRGVDLIVAMLAVIKAGGAYLPLDMSLPRARLVTLLDASGAMAVVDDEGAPPAWSGHARPHLSVREAIATGDSRPPQVRPRSDNLAYVMFTSGSTGAPKAVAATHEAVLRLVLDIDYAEITPDEVMLQLAPSAFDASTFEIWGALLNGATLAIHPDGVLDLYRLGQDIRRHGVTIAWLTAGLFHECVAAGVLAGSSVRQVLAGGDVVAPADVRAVLAQSAGVFINGYGPTECVTFSTCHRIDRFDEPGAVPIGRAVGGAMLHVLDADLSPTPPGGVGELYIAGDRLARGYHAAPGLTAERFIADPFGPPGGRMYRTGDRVRLRQDGALDYLGRLDRQVKVRGFRVDPEAVEAALEALDGVDRAVVLAHRRDGGVELHAVFSGSASVEAIRIAVRAALPPFMAPSLLTRVETLPLTASGKIDRASLSGLEPTGLPEAANQPLDAVETVLMRVWSSVLSSDRLGLDDDFFAAGGHSLKAARAMAEICDRLDVQAPTRLMFEAPTIRDLAQVLREDYL